MAYGLPDRQPDGSLPNGGADHFLRRVTSAVIARPVFWLAATFSMAVVSIVATLLWMEFRTSRADLISPSAEFHQRWTAYTKAFGDASDLVVVFEADDPDSIKLAQDDLGERLRAEAGFFSHVLYRVEAGHLRSKGLQYLSPSQLENGLTKLKEFRPILEGDSQLSLEGIANGLLFQLSEPMPEKRPAEQTHSLVMQLTTLADSLELYCRASRFRSPWPEVMSVSPELRGAGDQVVYLMNDSGNVGFLKARPVQQEEDFDGAASAIARMRELIQEASLRHKPVRIGLTGIPVLESDEMRRSQSDMVTASLVSFFGVGVLLLLGFRGLRHPLLALVMLAVAMCWTFGYTTLAIGHLNILSVSFAAILIGLGIDFGIHYLARYLELRHRSLPLVEALEESSASVGVGILTAAATTSLAFFCAGFTDFLGVAELGLIAGGGVIFCALATFCVLPALIVVADRRTEPARLPVPFQGSLLRNAIARRPGIAVLASLFVLGLAAWKSVELDEDGRIIPRVGYDYNLLNLQANGIESVEIQRRIFHDMERQKRDGQGSLLFAVSLAESAEEARALRSQFLKLPEVDHVEELGSRIPVYPPMETSLLVQAFHAQLARLPESLSIPETVRPDEIGKTFERLLASASVLPGETARSATDSINGFLDQLDTLSLEEQVEILSQYQQRMAASLLAQFRTLRDSADPTPVTVEDLPEELTTRFISREGRWLIQVYPQDPIWDIEPLQRFVAAVRSVDPNATGTPLQNFEASRQIMRSYQQAAVYALVAVAFVLVLDFLGVQNSVRVLLPSCVITTCIAIAQWQIHGELDWWILTAAFVSLVASLALAIDWKSVLLCLVTLVPPLAGGVLLFGSLGAIGVDFNPANLIVLPLILGIGVDDGVHVVHDFRSQRGAYHMSPSTMNAIVLTSLTSMIGFGSMMLAAHRGLYSLGLVLVLGIGNCLFMSLVLLPAMLVLARRWQMRTKPAAEG
jgi:hopanoid biosynthesis associated RND transporter like protein HpnN